MKPPLFALTAFLALASFAPNSFAEDWSFYHGPQNNRISSESVSAIKWPAAGPKVSWRIATPLGFSSFTTGGGGVYTVVQRDVEGIPTEVCVALDASSGKEKWHANMGISKYDRGGKSGARGNDGGDGPRSTPTYDGGMVYVIDSKIKLHCFDGKSGKEKWSVDVIKDHGGSNIRWSNAASPLIDDGLIFLAGGGKGQSLLAVDKTSGKVVWKRHDEKMTHASPIAAYIHGRRQIIFFTQSGLVSVSPETGDLLWMQPFPYKVSTAASPVVFEDIVYCSAGYGVGGGAYRISKDGAEWSSQEIWRKPNKVINHWSTPVCKDGYLYGMFSFKKYGAGPLACVDIKTGETKWEAKGFGPGNAILAGDKIIALSDDGQLVISEAKPDKYTELARHDVLKGKCWSSPIISNGKIYVRSTEEAAAVDVSRK